MILKLTGTKSIPVILFPVFLIAIIIIFSGCKMNIYPELVKKGMGSPDAHKCGECHIDIYDEWKESFHAKSYTSEEFKVSTNDYEFKFCLGCHVPETVFAAIKNTSEDNDETVLTGLTEEEITPRTYNLEGGVDCQSCHLTADCTLAGPFSGFSPHPIKKVELYQTSNFCGTCHIDTFKESLLYANNIDDKTCQDCHMPAINRKLIQDEPWQKIHIKKEGKAHTFSSSDAIKNNEGFLEMSFVDIKQENNQITGVLEVENTIANHSIPTGMYGYKEVVLSINLKDAFGVTIESKNESMFVEHGTQLKPKEKRVFQFAFNIDDKTRDFQELEAVIYKTDFNRINKVFLAKVEQEIE